MRRPPTFSAATISPPLTRRAASTARLTRLLPSSDLTYDHSPQADKLAYSYCLGPPNTPRCCGGARPELAPRGVLPSRRRARHARPTTLCYCTVGQVCTFGTVRSFLVIYGSMTIQVLAYGFLHPNRASARAVFWCFLFSFVFVAYLFLLLFG